MPIACVAAGRDFSMSSAAPECWHPEPVRSPGAHLQVPYLPQLPSDLLYLLGTSYVRRILTGKRKLGKTQRIGSVRRCLSGRNQLIGRGNRIMNLGYHFEDHVIGKSDHAGQSLMFGPNLTGILRISDALAVEYAVLVDFFDQKDT